MSRASRHRAVDTGVRCLQGVVWRVGLLAHLLEEVMRQEEQGSLMPITAADLSCSLLTRLKSMLHHYSLQGGSRGQRMTASVHIKLQDFASTNIEAVEIEAVPHVGSHSCSCPVAHYYL